MSRRRDAEEGASESARELADSLRRLRARSGLTLTALAERTPYSKSSWERYLNGKNLPPRQAVASFAQAVGVRPDRLLVLWELAVRAQPARGRRPAGPGEDAVVGAEAEPTGGRLLAAASPVSFRAVVGVVALAFLAGLLTGWALGRGSGHLPGRSVTRSAGHAPGHAPGHSTGHATGVTAGPTVLPH
ncbi:helix-turn-helix domain-containing protein [Allostreptomyces psammosilenae]|uniref:Transcriptional regulator with XRE-family HTH domain n=1 Tax=Allostreptomyces psammosilenae TaxID=1892865 RepID=A0A853A1M8_9ACTN|nr:helix-turn-helix transcriptional regulator [Allostreptomyces psammosilenae]NYI08315.1 transcriptional regulator with XRE-family HTH domain [Allostreptomyces psammosilenae]